MTQLDRRRFLQVAGAAGGATALATMLPASIARAASIPASRVHGDIRDVEHIVVLMQENRSFDHYFGTMRGVRGFGDPHPAVLPSGKSVFHQVGAAGEVLPFRPDAPDLGLTFIEDLAHDWNSTHSAFNLGRYDGWVPAKGSTTMAHLQRSDIPFHYALADAFTICDSYHCSLMGPTDPNRYYLWTGWVGNDGKGAGPVIDNAEAGYDWMTYPERLEAAGVPWKIYQDIGVGLDGPGYYGYTDDAYIGNYGDTSVLYFDNYQNAAPGSPLYEKARTGTNAAAGDGLFDVLKADVAAGNLPSISYVVAPEAFCEHPNWPPNYGAWYVSQVIDALTSDPEVWSKTALFITFDENDGFFDHLVPPHVNTAAVPGASTVDTTLDVYSSGNGYVTGPYGLGQRVPMLVVSPWSTGGWVNSEMFDHTSVIRFMEARFGVVEPQITPWRRTVCGDLTSAFDFARHAAGSSALPSTAGYLPPDDARHPDYVPVPPAVGAVPTQERGIRPARAIGYDLSVVLTHTGSQVSAVMQNRGSLGAHLQARSLTIAGAPFSYTVGSGTQLTAHWPTPAGTFDVSVHGPNGFYRHLAGTAAPSLIVDARRLPGDTIEVSVSNPGRSAVHAVVTDAYGGHAPGTLGIGARQTRVFLVSTLASGGWYDLAVTCPTEPAFAWGSAGHLESGLPSISDPQLGR